MDGKMACSSDQETLEHRGEGYPFLPTRAEGNSVSGASSLAPSRHLSGSIPGSTGPLDNGAGPRGGCRRLREALTGSLEAFSVEAACALSPFVLSSLLSQAPGPLGSPLPLPSKPTPSKDLCR